MSMHNLNNFGYLKESGNIQPHAQQETNFRKNKVSKTIIKQNQHKSKSRRRIKTSQSFKSKQNISTRNKLPIEPISHFRPHSRQNINKNKSTSNAAQNQRKPSRFNENKSKSRIPKRKAQRPKSIIKISTISYSKTPGKAKKSHKRKKSIINTRLESRSDLRVNSNTKIKKKVIYADFQNQDYEAQMSSQHQETYKQGELREFMQNKQHYRRKKRQNNQISYSRTDLDQLLKKKQTEQPNHRNYANENGIMNNNSNECHRRVKTNYDLGNHQSRQILPSSENRFDFEEKISHEHMKKSYFRDQIGSEILSQAPTVNHRSENQEGSYSNNALVDKYLTKTFDQDQRNIDTYTVKNKRNNALKMSESTSYLMKNRSNRMLRNSQTTLDKDVSNPYGLSAYEQHKQKYNNQMRQINNTKLSSNLTRDQKLTGVSSQSQFYKKEYRDNYQKRAQNKYQNSGEDDEMSHYEVTDNIGILHKQLMKKYDGNNSTKYNKYSNSKSPEYY